ncbi:MAG: thioredoxin-disulfide reductase [Endomicrobia bacterium]|nr:thioredoxin-disulfide reductase [Endomicrobiia bacterium]
MSAYDVAIIGAGPAGLSSSIYTSRAILKTIVFNTFVRPTQVILTDLIENYPGFTEGIVGFDLIENFKKQAMRFGVEIVDNEVNNIQPIDNNFLIYTSEHKIVVKAIILAVGRRHKKLEIEKEDFYIGKGISYCAVCDANFYRDKIVIVVGGGDTAFTEALYLTKYVKKLYVVHRRNEFRATKILQEKLHQKNNVEFVTPYIIEQFLGESKLQAVRIKNLLTNEHKTLECDGVFVCVGHQPNTDFLKGLIKLDENGYIITDENLHTSFNGIFACGDCRKDSIKQIITAAAEGVKAAFAAIEYVEKIK